MRATLISRYGHERAILVNLSEHGCCIEVEILPHGDDLIVRWQQFEAHGQVAWVDENRIGVRFFQPISFDWLIETRLLNETSGKLCHLVESREIARAWVEGKRLI